MTTDFVIKIFPYLHEKEKETMNKIWDKTHGLSYVEGLYHHKLEHTNPLVLKKWFSYKFSYRRMEIDYGYAFQHKEWKRMLSYLDKRVQSHINKADMWFKKRFHINLCHKATDFVVVKITERLLKLRESKKISNEKAKYLFNAIDSYVIKDVSDYDYEFFNAIINICRAKIK